ncbi:MAG: hypothetical protein JNN30_06945 [Rhodanobacteraceae bacterium]|nr:hypothetical protein [Rhodanobacteraceae bacterium]
MHDLLQVHVFACSYRVCWRAWSSQVLSPGSRIVWTPGLVEVLRHEFAEGALPFCRHDDAPASGAAAALE